MASDHNSLLRFSVEESIWFQKGQEVEELYSLSLDPNVTVQDMDQYVVIKGELFLAGEYKREQSSIREEDESFSFVSPKTIRSFEERENGLFEFQHSFPVDITIPANRISSLEDVSVAISSFDYSMPERNCLTLCAELMISGIYGEQQNAPEPQPELFREEEAGLLYRSAPSEIAEAEAESHSSPYYYESSIFAPPDRELFIPFEAEAKKIPEEEASPEPLSPLFEREEQAEPEAQLHGTTVFHTDTVPEAAELQTEEASGSEFLRSAEAPEQTELRSEESLERAESQIELSQPALLAEEAPGQSELPTEEAPEQDERTTDQAVLYIEEEKADHHNDTSVQRAVSDLKQGSEEQRNREYPVNKQPDLVVVQQKEEDTQKPAALYQQERTEGNDAGEVSSVPKLKKESVEPAPLVRERSQAVQEHENQASKGSREHVSLTDFLGKKEEQGHTRVKVCLVQQGDTLNSLASRYDISANAILALNELDSASEISEGQVLYIPSKPVTQKR
ncbi:stage VI sporulation protein D [Peribacillus deserti]|uniref:Stage VI sporulation protein D n=1 Tax=Peribacillus deserti TaxID=673318 RepID=A0ABS2QHF0_9BACI|nr:LysM peptidoglycan-binding domain-containing protein [Peribacillus deserti]MBM7691943.1 stage VI sporulation protein D [Peribacillus deserti]